MDISQGKVFYKPEGGMYLATIIDVVEKPNTQTSYGPKNKVLIVWTITQLNGAQYLDPEGNPYQVTAFPTASMNDKSTQPLFRNLYKIITGVIGGQPPLITSSEQLESLLIGRSNGLLVTKEANPNKAGDFYVNPVGLVPLALGQTPPPVPASFVRAKNRPKTQAGPQGQPVQTYAVPPSTATGVAATAGFTPTPEQIAAFLAAQKTTQPTNTVSLDSQAKKAF